MPTRQKRRIIIDITETRNRIEARASKICLRNGCARGKLYSEQLPADQNDQWEVELSIQPERAAYAALSKHFWSLPPEEAI